MDKTEPDASFSGVGKKGLGFGLLLAVLLSHGVVPGSFAGEKRRDFAVPVYSTIFDFFPLTACFRLSTDDF